MPFLKKAVRSTWLDVAIIGLLGLLPLTWFRGSMIAGWDLPWPLADPSYLMKASLTTWNPSVCLGAPDPSFRIGAYLAGNLGLSKIGLSNQSVEMLWFVLLFASAGLSAYLLVRVLYPGHRLAAVTGALFYMLNPYNMIVRWDSLNLWPFFYAFLPLLLALFALLIQSGRLRYLIFFLLAAVLISPSHANLGSIVILAIALGGYLVTYLVQNRRARDKLWLALRYTLILVVLFIGISMWWILPTIASLQAEASTRLEPGTTTEVLEWSSNYSTWDRVLRLQGYQGMEGEYPGTEDPVTPYAEDYYTPLIWVLGWLIPALAIAGLWKVRRNPGLVWPAILWVGGVFLMKGVQPPLGGVTRFLYDIVPGMSIFRVPYDKFGLLAVLGLAPLIGAGMESLFNLTRSLTKKRPWNNIIGATVLVIVAVLLFGIYVWPLWSGNNIYEGGNTMPSLRVDGVPEGYEEARGWLQEQQEEFRILPLPYNRGYWALALFDWYLGHDPTRWLLEGDTMTPDYGFTGGETAASLANDVLAGRQRGQLLCTLLNVKYVFLREDANWEVIDKYPPSWPTGYITSDLASVRESLEDQDWLEPAARFGSLTFYLNRNWKPLQVYSASGYEAVDLVTENLLETEETPWQGFGQVKWNMGSGGELTVTSTSDTGPSWVGIRRPIELGDGPFVYSYELKTEDVAQAHLRLRWHGENNKVLEKIDLQPRIYGDTGWTSYSGAVIRPYGAVWADLMLTMRPHEGATLEARELVLKEQPWLQALNQEARAGEGESGGPPLVAGASLLISGEDVERMGIEESPGPTDNGLALTVEQTSPWSAHVKVTAEGPAFVVLNQAFDAGWRIYEGSPGWLRVLLGSGRSPMQHFLANGYANGWYLDQPGEYELTLYYWPQTLLYLGAVISVLTWVLVAAWYLLRRKSLRGRIWRKPTRQDIAEHAP